MEYFFPLLDLITSIPTRRKYRQNSLYVTRYSKSFPNPLFRYSYENTFEKNRCFFLRVNRVVLFVYPVPALLESTLLSRDP